MKGNLAGLAMAAIAACGLMLGGCVAEAGDEDEGAVATSAAPTAPGQIPGAPGLKTQDTGPTVEPEPQPWQATPTPMKAATVVPRGHHGNDPPSGGGVSKTIYR